MAVIGNNQCFATKFLAVPTLSWTTQAEHNLPTRCETIATARTVLLRLQHRIDRVSTPHRRRKDGSEIEFDGVARFST